MMLVPARRADRVLSLMLVLADTVSIPATFFITFWLRDGVLGRAIPGFDARLSEYVKTIPFIWALWIACFASTGLYRPRRHLGGMGEAQKLLRAILYLAVSMMAASYLAKEDYSRLMLLFFSVLSLPVSATARMLARRLSQAVAPVSEVPRVLVVGVGETAQRVRASLERLPGNHPVVAGFISADDPEAPAEVEGIPVAGGLADLPRLVQEMGIDEVFFASHRLSRPRILEVVSAVESKTVHFRLVSDLFELASTPDDLENLARLPIVEIGSARNGILFRAVKRTFDILASLLLLVALSPLLLAIWLILLAGRRGSPIFRQTRIGLRGTPFTLYKFRTMKPEASEYEVAPLGPDDDRVTGFGRLLRRTSLDELPQLVHVLSGRMSMVGPRPEMPFIVQGYTDWQRRRLEVKPGITGLWQIMGRKELPLHENIEFDFLYMRNQSLMLDFAILLRTFVTVFRGRGAY